MNTHMINSNVNGFLALMFVGVFALGAGLLIWHAAFGENPIANAMTSELVSQYQNY